MDRKALLRLGGKVLVPLLLVCSILAIKQVRSPIPAQPTFTMAVTVAPTPMPSPIADPSPSLLALAEELPAIVAYPHAQNEEVAVLDERWHFPGGDVFVHIPYRAMTFATEDSPSVVLEFYQATLPTLAWQKDNEYQDLFHHRCGIVSIATEATSEGVTQVRLFVRPVFKEARSSFTMPVLVECSDSR